MMKIKNTFATALAILVFTSAWAQSYGEIHGRVVDISGNPVIGAIVKATVAGQVVGSSTDENGKYRIKPLPPSSYNVEINATGYESWKIEQLNVDAEKITIAPTATLNEFVFDRPPVVVSAERYTDPLIDPDLASVSTLRSKQLKHLPSAHGGNIKNIVANMTADIKVDPNGTDLYFRGSRSGTTLYFIDGVKVHGIVPTVPSSGISALQVYTGGLPAKYGDCTGGVVVVTTKSYIDDYRND